MCIRDSYVYQKRVLCFLFMRVMSGRLEGIILAVIMLRFQYSLKLSSSTLLLLLLLRCSRSEVLTSVTMTITPWVLESLNKKLSLLRCNAIHFAIHLPNYMVLQPERHNIHSSLFAKARVSFCISVTSVTRHLQWKLKASHRTLSKRAFSKILILNAVLKYGVLHVDEDKIVASFPYFLPNKATPENSSTSVFLTFPFLTSVSCNPIKGETNFLFGFSYLRKAQSNSYHSICPYSGTS